MPPPGFNVGADSAINTDSTRSETITFRDDGTHITEVMVAKPCPAPHPLYKHAMNDKPHDLKNFLQRPVRIGTGVWQNQTAGTNLGNWTFPDALLQPAASSCYGQNIAKVVGFVGIKAKVKVRVQFNSQPFQAGIVMLSYMPYADYMPARTDVYYGLTSSTLASLPSSTANPCVYLNLANATSFEIEVPYMSPFLYANLITGQGTFGRVFLTVISPVASNGDKKVSYTVFANFVDPEIVYPTVGPPATVFAQAGGEMEAMENRQSVANGTLSSAVATLESIPELGLGALYKTVDYVVNNTANVLTMLGFSKPFTTAPVTRVTSNDTAYMNNADGPFYGNKLALTTTNELQHFSGWVESDIDEMLFSNVVARKAYVDSFTWTSTSAVDAVIFNRNVSPFTATSISDQQPNGISLLEKPTPARFISSMFSYWRGTMVYTFKFAKTMFHSGRLRVSFLPYRFNVTSLSSIAGLSNELGYAYTEDIDLSTTSEFSFRVPFVSTRPFMQTTAAFSSLSSGDIQNFATGSIIVAVLNQLVNSPQASGSIDIPVFVHMEDAEFAGPKMFVARNTYSNIRSLPSSLAASEEKEVIEAQAGGKAGIVPVKSHSELDNGHASSIISHTSCVGEVVTSWRQLLKTFQPVAVFQTIGVDATATRYGSTGNSIIISPWAPCAPDNTNSQVVPSAAPWNYSPLYQKKIPQNAGVATTPLSIGYSVYDYYSFAYSQYAFFRGSMRYIIVSNYYLNNATVEIINYADGAASPYRPPALAPDFDTSECPLLSYGPISQEYDIPPFYSGTLRPTNYPPATSFASRQFFNSSFTVSFEVPYYSTGHMCPTSLQIPDATEVRKSLFPQPLVRITGIPEGAVLYVYRAVGDDFEFGCRLGIPPVRNYYVAPTGPSTATAPPPSRVTLDHSSKRGENKESNYLFPLA